MTAAVEIFRYADQHVRTVLVEGDPWFVALDVAAVLDLGNVRSSLALLDDDERGVHTVDTPGGPQQVAIVSESGLYSLILRSRKLEAKAFKRWITHDVIPSIRRTGSYSKAPAELTRTEILRLALDSEEKRLAAESRVAELEPRAEQWDRLASATGDYAVADAAKILSRDPQIKLGRDRLFTLLREMGWAYRQQADRRHRTYQRAVDAGWLSELASSHYHPRTGELVIDPPQIRVTVKGMGELHRRLTAADGAA